MERIPWRLGLKRWTDYPAIFDPFSVARGFRPVAMFNPFCVSERVARRRFPELSYQQDGEGNLYVAQEERALERITEEPFLFQAARKGGHEAFRNLGALLSYPSCCTDAALQGEGLIIPGIPFKACSSECARPWVEEWEAMYHAFRHPQIFRALFYG